MVDTRPALAREIGCAEIALCFSPHTKQLCANPHPGFTQPTEELK